MRPWLAIVLAAVVVGCGSERVDVAAAIQAVQRTAPYQDLRIRFPARPGRADCTLGQGGPAMQSSPGVQQPPGTIVCRTSAEARDDGSVLVTFSRGRSSWSFEVSRAGVVTGP